MWLRSLIVASVVALGATAGAVEWLQFTAAEMLQYGTSDGLVLSANGQSLELARGVLVHDDGPAAGYSYRPNEERLQSGIAIRKQLRIADPQAFETYLLIGGSGTFTAEINGVAQKLEPRGKAGNYWQQYLLPAGALRQGLNHIVLRGQGKIWIARDDERPPGSEAPPNRSAKSIDDGRTWNDAQLGTNNDVDGEYCVRVYLDQHRPTGVWTSPLIDVANLRGAAVAPFGKPTDAIRFNFLDARTPVNCSMWAQAGDNQMHPLSESSLTLYPHVGRYVQLRIMMNCDFDARQTPRLSGVNIGTESSPKADWVSQLKMIAAPGVKLRRSTIAFPFERSDHPRLKQLREQERLDDVVAGAKTEWEQITRLAAWSAVRWSKRTGHLSEAYPRWDALDILATHADGTPVGGFCRQYNVVFLQACESFGIRGRAVSIGPGEFGDLIRSGHEVVELWSNDYRKWVHVDGDFGRYYVDAESRTPLSLLELHDRQIAALAALPHRAVEAVQVAKDRDVWGGLTAMPPFLELRMIPRSDFLARPHPLPLNEGMRGWFWPDYRVWSDAEAPPARLYGNRVTSRSNWEWSLNETEVQLTATKTPGELQVDLETNTPGFAGYEAEIDGAAPAPVKTGFTWKLHAGENRLVVRARNETGPLPETMTVLEWTPEKK